MAPERVKKRDGRIVPFDLRKIAAAIAKTFAATGEGDPSLAGELAQVVAMTLARHESGNRTRGASRRPAAWVPTIEEIQDLVERVLMETGYAKAAKAYILYRDKRARLRELLSVRESEPSGELRVEGPGGAAQSWSKGRIAAALMQEADLPRETAEQIASRVEEKVFGSGITRLSTTLIRELVDNELFAMGLESKRRKQTLIGIPKFDFGQLLRSGVLARNGETQVVGSEPVVAAARHLVERYALEEVLPQEVADLHRDAQLHFPGLGAIEKEFSLSFRASELLAGRFWPRSLGINPEPGSPRWADAEFLSHALAHLTIALHRNVSGPVVIEEAQALAARAAHEGEFWRILDLRAQLLRELGCEIAISGPAPEPTLPSLRFLEPVAGFDTTWIGPGIERPRGDASPVLACGATASVNAPRIAMQAGPWQDSRLLESLVQAMEKAALGLRAIAEFQRQARLARENFAPPSRVHYAVSIEGLVETVRFSREGSFDPDLARTMRSVGVEFLRDLSIRNQIAFVLEENGRRESAGRFARADLDRFPQTRNLISPDNPVYHSQMTVAENVR